MGALSVSNNMVEVSLIFGGMSPEHAASRESFSYVYDQLCTENCGVCISHVYYVDSDNDVSFYDFDRSWHSRDYMVSKDAVDYATFAKHVLGANGYIVNLLHGNYGEDGHIQGLANIVGLRGTFGPVLPSSLAMSKIHMQCYVSGSQSTIKVPATLTLTDAKSCSAVAEIKNLFDGLEVVVKPNSLGASLFTERYTVSDIEISIIEDNLRAIFKYDERVLIQEFVEGQEYSIGCIRLDHKVVVLPAIRIDTKRGFFGHEEKHRIGSADEVLMEEDTVEILHMKRVSRDLFDELGFSHMCRFDYILTPSGDVYFLEANPIPGLMRKTCDLLKNKISIPVINVIDATISAVKASGFKKVGLLGTKYVMERGFYVDRFGVEDIEVSLPEAHLRYAVHAAIYDDLCLHNFSKKAKSAVYRAMDNLIDQGVESLILGCTELPLIVDERSEYGGVDLIDSIDVHIAAALGRQRVSRGLGAS